MLRIVDPSNAGFEFNTNFRLWEWDGKQWVRNYKPVNKTPDRLYAVFPSEDKPYIERSYPIFLSSYENIHRGARYAITVGLVDGYILFHEFTIAE